MLLNLHAGGHTCCSLGLCVAVSLQLVSCVTEGLIFIVDPPLAGLFTPQSLLGDVAAIFSQCSALGR